MKLPMYIVNAFAEGPFSGNPAAVVISSDPLPEVQRQAVAAQNNLSDTAFVVSSAEIMGLCWFTPTAEVDLCGHAILAALAVLADMSLISHSQQFFIASGVISLSREGPVWQLNFPARQLSSRGGMISGHCEGDGCLLKVPVPYSPGVRSTCKAPFYSAPASDGGAGAERLVC
ncbi:PhzF family phenazine biosynthesis protein [Gilvimarinus sp. 1_MG-2023]|uniref:PhzF family phenazine biosynthesis protein n=1 Tax=Gilvimarinus sp. 1_MG-2023 TaxID=3062638 RepID=UPI0026E19F02|nr:PhzF family phenazine biosynthesis protein [Gilvimarinus sp. 1_MG-2023]MDO6747614.1 PhzF family phenazine biosynthesis protein [Gilvimarinus sp. 1_MG-2023]